MTRRRGKGPTGRERQFHRAMVQSAEVLRPLLHDFDYRVDADDFFLYQLSNFIEDGRASFEDPGFRGLVEEGVHYHVDERIEIRTALAGQLRSAYSKMDGAIRKIASQVVGALEDAEFPLRSVGAIVHTYTSYLFRRLEDAAAPPTELEDEALTWIERWRRGEVPREQLASRLKAIGSPVIGPVADWLFDAITDRTVTEVAMDILASIPSAASTRVLAHTVSEPMLEEDLEERAYHIVRERWPHARPFILHSIKEHDHEDIPFRWYQLLVECDELCSVDLILEEVRIHAPAEHLREDLIVLVELLNRSRDPGVEGKIRQLLADPDAPLPAARLLKEWFAVFTARPEVETPEDNPWLRQLHFCQINERYIEAAQLFDEGLKDEAGRKLDSILEVEPGYPFAKMLRQMIETV